MDTHVSYICIQYTIDDVNENDDDDDFNNMHAQRVEMYGKIPLRLFATPSTWILTCYIIHYTLSIHGAKNPSFASIGIFLECKSMGKKASQQSGTLHTASAATAAIGPLYAAYVCVRMWMSKIQFVTIETIH